MQPQNLSLFISLQLLGVSIVRALPSQPWEIADPTSDAGIQKQKLCYPPIDPSKDQYIVGYGSLIQTVSKDRTGKKSGDTIPVQISGFRRDWCTKGDFLGPGTIFLGVRPNHTASLNGVIFQLLSTSGNISETLHQYDLWEAFYCREQVELKNLQILAGVESDSLMNNSQHWIYVTRPEYITEPGRDNPIVQSYVDIFLSGCLEVQDKFKLKDFAKMCVDTTDGWSKEHWVNDRISPRRPWVHQPKAWFIDNVLKERIPIPFQNIKVESFNLRVQ